jgi:hypothetical protein
LNFPFEVETVAGAAALGRRDALLAEGCYPVIAGSPDNLEPLIQGYESSARGGACLEAVKGIDVDDWLARRLASWMSDPEYHEQHGDWPSDWSSEVDPTRAFTGPTDIVTGELLAEVAIVLVPTSESWHVPCLVGYGDWNACPAPPVHSAVLKRWQERHGATLVTMSHDTIELAVERPIQTREDALALASEQYIYCPDIVAELRSTIETLAAALLRAPVWFFWWD